MTFFVSRTKQFEKFTISTRSKNVFCIKIYWIPTAHLCFFNFICNVDCSLAESESREIIFECMKKSKIAKRLDVSDEFWKQFEMYDKSNKKVMGLYEIGSIDNQNICTIAINPKEYFEKFKNRKINKKRKGVRRDTEGMSFKAYANRTRHSDSYIAKAIRKKLPKKDLRSKIQI